MEMSRQQDSVQFPLYIMAIHLPESGRAARTVPGGSPQPSLTPIARSDLIFPAMGFSAKIATEEGPAGGVGHWHLLPGVGLSLSQAQVHQEGLCRGDLEGEIQERVTGTVK